MKTSEIIDAMSKSFISDMCFVYVCFNLFFFMIAVYIIICIYDCIVLLYMYMYIYTDIYVYDTIMYIW